MSIFSIFLEAFLEDGRKSDGKVPDILFEQVPFDHPLTINFTSGTAGLPKAAVHSVGVSKIFPLKVILL